MTPLQGSLITGNTVVQIGVELQECDSRAVAFCRMPALPGWAPRSPAVRALFWATLSRSGVRLRGLLFFVGVASPMFCSVFLLEHAACVPAVLSASSRSSLLMCVRVALAHVAFSPLGELFGHPRVGFARFTSTFKF